MFDCISLQRYMSGKSAIQVINDEGFYFRRIDGYPEDPTEGDREVFGISEQRCFEGLSGKITMTPEEAKQLSCKVMHKEKQNLFIQSWFWHEQMSRFMWETYGKFPNSPDCALFVVNRIELELYLCRVLPIGHRFGPVKYVQDKQSQQEAFFTKQVDFKHEHEYRISISVGELIFFNKKILPELDWPARHVQVHCEEDPAQYYCNRGAVREDIFKYVGEDGFILKAPLPELLKAVYIPASASVEFCAQLDELLASKGYVLKCQRIELPAD